MSESGFHFAYPLWLALLPMPVLLWLWLKWSATLDDESRYRAYADRHLLPLLLGGRQQHGRDSWRRLIPWAIGWMLMVVAMATPRWGFEERQIFRSGIELVVLLDLSDSMNATDVAPSRIARARQEIDDLILQNRRARIGLVAFASLAHVVSPLTEDGATLRRQLPALGPELLRLKGSRLPEGLFRARQMLAASDKKSSRHVLLVSDGDFAEDALEAVQVLAADGIHVHALGVGSAVGGAVSSANGQPVRDIRGDVVFSRLNEGELQKLAATGNGVYRLASFRDDDTGAILKALDRTAEATRLKGQKARVWNERFYLPLLVALLFLLPLFRSGRRTERRLERSRR